MTKTELRKIIDADIMYYFGRATELIEHGHRELRTDYVEKIQGMLIIAMDTKLIDYNEWNNCMTCLYSFAYCNKEWR